MFTVRAERGAQGPPDSHLILQPAVTLPFTPFPQTALDSPDQIWFQGQGYLLVQRQAVAPQFLPSGQWPGQPDAWARLAANSALRPTTLHRFAQSLGTLSLGDHRGHQKHILCVHCSDPPVLCGARATHPAPEVAALCDTGAAKTRPGEAKPCPSLSGGLGNT